MGQLGVYGTDPHLWGGGAPVGLLLPKTFLMHCGRRCMLMGEGRFAN